MNPIAWAVYGLHAILIGGLAYAATRGTDGKPGAWFVGSAVIAVMCLTNTAWFHAPGGNWVVPVLTGVLLFASSCTGMLIKPEVEEMAGMMLLFIPATVVGIALLNLLLWFVLDWRSRRSKNRGHS